MTIYKPENHVEVYRVKAKCRDLHELSGRTGRPELTEFVLNSILRKIPFAPGDTVVDIGCGEGSLLAKVSALPGFSGKLVGTVPTEEEAVRVRQRLAGAGTHGIDIRVGLSSNTGLPDRCADKIIVNSVMLIVGDEAEVDRTLHELSRIAKPGATLFIGEQPAVDEFAGRTYGDSITAWLWWVLKHQGIKPFLTRLKQTLINSVSSEPFIIAPKTYFFIAPERFVEKLEAKGFHVKEHYRHKEIDFAGNPAESPTRWDYLTVRR